MPFSGPKQPIWPEQIFFGTNHYCYFHLHIGPFNCANLEKFLQQIHSYGYVPFLGPKRSICPKQKFFGKLESFSSIYYPLSLRKFLKKFFHRIHSYEDAQFWVQNGQFPQMRIFFRKPVNEKWIRGKGTSKKKDHRYIQDS